MINEKNVQKFLKIQFEYGRASFISCDCFGLFLLTLQEFEGGREIYTKIYNIFTQTFYNQNICFEKINEILLPYKSNEICNKNELVVIKIRTRIHCGIIVNLNDNNFVLHACEKNGVTLSQSDRFFSLGTEIARYDIEQML